MAPWAIVYHSGRRSGRGYRIPVMAFPTETGYVFALTYGRKVDWVKNLIASGGGTLKYKGDEIPICGIRFEKYCDVKEMFPSWIRLSLRIISLEDCLLVEIKA
jgi:deazaflavin-dependent oxidoreductase (nitroreductase family)